MKVRTAIAAVTGFRFFLAQRLVRSVTDNHETVPVHAVSGDQILYHGLGPLLAERHVGSARPGAVRIALDTNAAARECLGSFHELEVDDGFGVFI